MTHEVVILSKAKSQLYQNALWWAENRSMEQAIRWLNGFETKLQTLSINPERHAIIREQALFGWEHNYRQLLYGMSGQFTHRAIYRFNEKTVFVISIRHLSQQDISPDSL